MEVEDDAGGGGDAGGGDAGGGDAGGGGGHLAAAAPHRQRQHVVVVVDGANVGFAHGRQAGFSALGVALAVEFFAKRGHPTLAMLPDRPTFTRAEPVARLAAAGALALIPPRDADDLYMLEFARSRGGYVVSNDLFRDHVAAWRAAAWGAPDADALAAWVATHVISYTWVGDELLPHPVTSRQAYDAVPPPGQEGLALAVASSGASLASSSAGGGLAGSSSSGGGGGGAAAQAGYGGGDGDDDFGYRVRGRGRGRGGEGGGGGRWDDDGGRRISVPLAALPTVSSAAAPPPIYAPHHHHHHSNQLLQQQYGEGSSSRMRSDDDDAAMAVPAAAAPPQQQHQQSLPPVAHARYSPPPYPQQQPPPPQQQQQQQHLYASYAAAAAAAAPYTTAVQPSPPTAGLEPAPLPAWAAAVVASHFPGAASSSSDRQAVAVMTQAARPLWNAVVARVLAACRTPHPQGQAQGHGSPQVVLSPSQPQPQLDDAGVHAVASAVCAELLLDVGREAAGKAALLALAGLSGGGVRLGHLSAAEADGQLTPLPPHAGAAASAAFSTPASSPTPLGAGAYGGDGSGGGRRRDGGGGGGGGGGDPARREVHLWSAARRARLDDALAAALQRASTAAAGGAR